MLLLVFLGLFQRRYRAPQHLQLGLFWWNTQDDVVIPYTDDCTVDPAAGGNPVSILEIAQHCLLLLPLALIRQKQDEIENRNDGQERQKTEKGGRSRIRLQKNDR